MLNLMKYLLLDNWDIVTWFILSMKWLWIIVIFLAYRLIKNIINVAARNISLKSDMILRDTKYSEDEILQHLDYIIKEILDEYTLLYITPKNIYYINSKLEKEIIDYISNEAPKRISKVLVTQLSFIYNESYIGTFIGHRIYLTVLNYVLEYNVTKEPIGAESSNVKNNS